MTNKLTPLTSTTNGEYPGIITSPHQTTAQMDPPPVIYRNYNYNFPQVDVELGGRPVHERRARRIDCERCRCDPLESPKFLKCLIAAICIGIGVLGYYAYKDDVQRDYDYS